MLGTYRLKWATMADDPVLWMVNSGMAAGEPTLFALFNRKDEAEAFIECEDLDAGVEPLVLNRRERWLEDQLWVVAVADPKSPDFRTEGYLWAVFAYRAHAQRYAERTKDRVSVGADILIYKLGLTLWKTSERSEGSGTIEPSPEAEAPPES